MMQQAQQQKKASQGASTVAKTASQGASNAASTAAKTASQGASSASKAASGASKAASGAAKTAGAASKSGGILGSLKNFGSKSIGKVANFAKGLNPLQSLKGALQSPIAKGFGKALGPIMAAVSGFVDISSLISTAKVEKEKGNTVDTGLLGKNIVQAGTYPIANFALNAIPGVGTAISLADGILGGFGLSPLKFITDNLIDLIPNDFFSGLGDFAISEGPKLAKGGIITDEINNATIGEAGAEAVVPLSEFYAKLDAMAAAHKEQTKKLEMINNSIMQGGDVYIDGNKAGHALVLASTKMS